MNIYLKAIMGIVGINILTAMFLKPKYGIFVLLFLQIGLTQSTTGLSIVEIAYVFSFFTVLTGWIFSVLLKKRKLVNSPLNFPLTVFLVLCLCSVVKALSNGVEFMTWFTDWRAYLNLLLFFVIANDFESREEIKWLIYSFLLVTVIITAKDLFSIYAQGYFLSEYHQEIAGIQFLSVYYLMGLPIAIALFIFNEKSKLKWLLLPLIMFFGLRLLVSLVRSYFLSILLSIGVVLIYAIKLRRKKAVLPLIIIPVICGLIFTTSLSQIITVSQTYVKRFLVLKDFESRSNFSALSRIAEVKAVASKSLEQLPMGHGFGIKYQYYRPNLEWHDASYVHFTPLYFLLTMGILGFSTIIWLVIQALRVNWYVFKKEQNLYWKGIALALYANATAIITISLFADIILTQTSIFYLALSMGIISAMKATDDAGSLYVDLSVIENSEIVPQI